MTTRSFKNLARTTGPALVLLASALIWEMAVRIFRIPPFLLPAPSAIFLELAHQPMFYFDHAKMTVLATVLGYLGAIVIGFAIAIAVIYSKVIEKTAFTLLVTLNAIPKIALAPLFIVWLGTDLAPKAAIAVMLAIFPIVIATVLGLKTVDPDMIDLSRTMRGSRFQILTKIRVPNAMPSVFAGLKVAITLAFSGAIVGEFIASQRGLGYVIVSSQANFDTAPMFGAIVVLAVIGTCLFFIIESLERLFLGWHVSRRRGNDRVLV